MAILAFLVDILLFVPHLSAGGYIVVGAPICLAIVVVGLCATRRRVVGKQDRKRRIAETANINNTDTSSNEGFTTEHGSTVDAGKSEFASFDIGKPGSDGPGLDETGERIPLNPHHQSPPPGMCMHRVPTDNSQGDYGHVVGGPQSNFPSRLPSRSLNQYNAGPLPPSHRLPLNNQNSHGTGAFGPALVTPQYGLPRYGPGPSGPRGGPYRGGPSPKPGYGGPRAPPQNDYAIGDQGRNTGSPGPHNGPPMGGFKDGNQYGVGGSTMPRGVSPGMQGMGPRRGPSPAQVYYQVSPTDARGQAPEPIWSGQQYGQQQQQKQLDVGDYPSDDDSRVDAESRGQPSRQDFITTALAPGPGSGGGRVAELEAPAPPDEPTLKTRVTSFLSEDGNSYIPPRTQCLTGSNQSNDAPVEQDENVVTTIHSSPPPNPRHSTPPGPVSPSSEEQNAVELPADVAPTSLIKPSKPSTGNYYEDVDPRFAERSQDVDLGNSVTTDEGMPAMLIPGYNPQIGSSRPPQSKSPVQFNKQNYGRPQNNPNSEHGYPYAPQNSDQQYVPYVHGRPPFPEYDAPPQSPAYSEQTNFTSISQRPVNPRWQQPPGQQPLGRGPPRNMPLLSGNPDFELPTLSQGRGGPRGRIPGAVPPGLGPDRRGRYPPTTSKYA